MPTIQSLPVELLSAVLTLTGHFYSSESIFASRYATLRATALVCRSWRKLSQQHLWAQVHLDTPSQVKSFIAGTLSTGSATSVLEIYGDDDIKAAGAARAVGVCRGLKELSLNSLDRFDLRKLFVPGLKNLKSLRIFDTSLARGELTSAPPFALSHLSYPSRNRDHSPSPLPALLFQPTLTSLHLTDPKDLGDAIHSRLGALATSLVHLSIDSYSSTYVQALYHFLHRCTAVKSFAAATGGRGTNTWIPSAFNWIPASLESLAVDAFTAEFTGMVELLRSRPVALSELRMLELPGIHPETEPDRRGHGELKEECEQRRVELFFQGWRV